MLSASLPRNIITIDEVPTLRPITREEARLMFAGKISCETLIHTGSVDIRKNPRITNRTTGSIPSVLKIKYVNGAEASKPARINRVLYFILSDDMTNWQDGGRITRM